MSRPTVLSKGWIEDRCEKIPIAGCWIWMKCVQNYGHGITTFHGQSVGAHRLAWMAFRGDPGELFVLHKCDVPSCCNPDHLFLGTQADNNRDRCLKGRNGNERLSAENVKSLKAMFTGIRGEIRRLAREFGVSEGLISLIRDGKVRANL